MATPFIHVISIHPIMVSIVTYLTSGDFRSYEDVINLCSAIRDKAVKKTIYERLLVIRDLNTTNVLKNYLIKEMIEKDSVLLGKLQ